MKATQNAATKATYKNGVLDVVISRKEKMKPENFEKSFDALWKKRSGEPVYIRGDKDVPYGTITNIIGIVKSIGGETVGLVVEERKTVKK